MTGLVCLQGGGEFSVGCREMDADLLARAGGGPVVVSALAGAVGREHDTANANGVWHFSALGADVVAAPDVRLDPEGALAALRRARLLVLPGGSPSRLLELLQTTGVGDVVREVLAAGGVVSGSSAGAMVLCAWTVLPDRGPSVVPGLGVVAGALVLPHWSGGRADWLRAVDDAVPAGTCLLGIPEESGVLLDGDGDGDVVAVGRSGTELLGQGRVLEPGAREPWTT
ncbi:MAG: peptidase dipeptidase [Frankiales bacterium]|nr:peptidase dipeptidase [Frankiales bacterium]